MEPSNEDSLLKNLSGFSLSDVRTPFREPYLPSDATLFSCSLPVISHKKGSEVHRQFLSLEDDVKGPIIDDSKEVGVLLPDDEEELLAGIAGDLDLSGLPTQIEDLEDYDFFGSGGGLELDSEPQERLFSGISKPYISDEILSNGITPFPIPNGLGTVAGEHPYGEHPSRTLFVRNINSNVEDSELRSLFEQYGDIRTLYTACKHRGFVMISYFDIRHARAAMRALQNKPLRRRKLDIHFSIPKDNPSEKDINQGTLVVFNLDPSVSNDDLYQIFGVHGEIKEIRETPHKRHHKFIEFYDVRGAEAALKALNRCDIAGKRIKLEPSRPGGTRRNFMQQVTLEFDPDEPRTFRPQTGSPLGSSPPGSWAQFGSPVEHSFVHNISQSPRYGGLSPGSSSLSYSLPGQKFSTSPVSFAGASPSSGIGTLSGPQFLWGSPSPSVWSASSYPNHHVGSAPSSNPLNRRFGFLAKSPEAPPSFGTIGSNRNQTHLTNSVNGSMFPRPSPYLGTCSVVSNGFIDPRNRSGLNQAVYKKQYELDLEKIASGEDSRTTLMIKNIPNKYTAKMLLAAIDEQHLGTYDFLYLPIDFKNKCNVGYAFINMISPSHIIPFYQAFNGKKWEKFNSEKVAVLAYARIQGKSNLVTHFQNSSLMNEDKCFRPILFRSDNMVVDEENMMSENMNVYVRQVDGYYSVDVFDVHGGGFEEQS